MFRGHGEPVGRLGRQVNTDEYTVRVERCPALFARIWLLRTASTPALISSVRLAGKAQLGAVDWLSIVFDLDQLAQTAEIRFIREFRDAQGRSWPAGWVAWVLPRGGRGGAECTTYTHMRVCACTLPRTEKRTESAAGGRTTCGGTV